jgi:DNA-binding NarL/FixJ family response regulator
MSVLELTATGRTRGEIARMLGLSERHVRQIANAPDPRQDDLFSE